MISGKTVKEIQIFCHLYLILTQVLEVSYGLSSRCSQLNFLNHLARMLKTRFTWVITSLKTVELTWVPTALNFLLCFLSELLIAEIDWFEVLHSLTKCEVSYMDLGNKHIINRSPVSTLAPSFLPYLYFLLKT